MPLGPIHATTAHFQGEPTGQLFSVVFKFPEGSARPTMDAEMRLLAPDNLPDVQRRIVPGARWHATGLTILTTGRTRDAYDGAEPAPNSRAAMNLMRLSHITGREDWKEKAGRTLALFGSTMAAHPESLPALASALDFALAPTRHILIAGDPEAVDTRALMRVAALVAEGCGAKVTMRMQLAEGMMVVQLLWTVKSGVVWRVAMWMGTVPVLLRVMVWGGAALPTWVVAKVRELGETV